MSKKLLVIGSTLVLVVVAGAFGALTYEKNKFRTAIEKFNNYKIPVDKENTVAFNLVDRKEDGLLSDKFMLNLNINDKKLPFELTSKYGIKSVSTKFSIKEDDINKLSNDPSVSKAIVYLADNSTIGYDVIGDTFDFTLNFKDISVDNFSLSSAYIKAAVSSISKDYDPKNVYSEAGFDKLSLKGDVEGSFNSYKMKSGYKSGYYMTQNLKSMKIEGQDLGKVELSKFEHDISFTPLSENNVTSLTNEFKFDKLEVENKGINVKVSDFAFGINLNNLNVSSVVELCPRLDFSEECITKVQNASKADNSVGLLVKLIGKDTTAKVSLSAEVNDSKLKAGVDVSFGEDFSPTNLVYSFDANASLEAKIFDKLPLLAMVAGPIKKFAADPNASVLEYHLSFKDNQFLLNGKPM